MVGSISACVLSCFFGFVQPEEPQNRQPEPPADVLRGPTVESAPTRTTLIERDFRGFVKRLEINPAQAATQLLELDEQVRARVQAILDERSALLDDIVQRNLNDIIAYGNDAVVGAARERREAEKRFAAMLEPLTKRGQLMQEIATILPSEQRRKMTSLVSGYYRALFESPPPELAGEGEAPTRQSLLRKEIGLQAGSELKRAVERVITQSSSDFDALLKALDLSLEKEARVRELATQAYNAAKGNLKDLDRQALMRSIVRELTGPERRRLFEHYRPKAEKPAPENSEAVPGSEESDSSMP